MPSFIKPKALFEWCQIPAEQLQAHPDARVKIKILPAPDDVHRWTAEDMIAEVVAANEAQRPCRWILPCGPTKQYPYFVSIVNQRRISLQNVHVFHMDDFLDWQGRPLKTDHPMSYEGWMNRNFYEAVDKDLAIPEPQRHFPRVDDLEAISKAIASVGGIDSTFGGIGYRGHIAYNEAPRSPWYTVTAEQFRNSKTRILHLNDDTLIALSQRVAGGLSHAIPPMAITLGMKDLLSARRIRLISDTGAWKQTVVRMLLFGPITTEYPVTFVQDHPDVLLVVDQKTAAPPIV